MTNLKFDQETCPWFHDDIRILYGVPPTPVDALPKVCTCGKPLTYNKDVVFASVVDIDVFMPFDGISMGCLVKQEECGLCKGRPCGCTTKRLPMDVPHFQVTGISLGNVDAVSKLNIAKLKDEG